MDDWLARYDGEVAYLLSDHRRVGTLFLEIQDWTFTEGPIFRRRKRYEKKLAWRVLFFSEGELPCDGFYEHRAEAAELEQNIFTFKGIEYTTAWLEQEEKDRVRSDFEN